MVAQRIAELRAKMQYRVAAIILFISALTSLIIFGLGAVRGVHIIYLSILAAILWYGGITMPMLAVEAKLRELHHTRRRPSVCQSAGFLPEQKRTRLCHDHGSFRQYDVMIVGGLIGLFSVIFPS